MQIRSKRQAEHRFDHSGTIDPGETVYVDFHPQNLFRVEGWTVDEGETDLELLSIQVRQHDGTPTDVSSTPSPSEPWPTCNVGGVIRAIVENTTDHAVKFRSRITGTEVE